jgi:Na+/phosphate symporter
MGLNAFTKTGNTVTFTAASTAPTAVQCVSTTLGGNQYRVINNGTVTVFLGYGTTAAEATTNAVQVTSSQAAFPLLPSTDEILTFVPNAYFTAVTASGTAVVYITPGDGL